MNVDAHREFYSLCYEKLSSSLNKCEAGYLKSLKLDIVNSRLITLFCSS